MTEIKDDPFESAWVQGQDHVDNTDLVGVVHL